MKETIAQSEVAENRKLHLARLPLWSGFISLTGLIWLLLTSDPGVGGPRLVLVFLATVFILLLSCFSILIQIVSHLIISGSRQSWYRILYSATVLSFGVVFLLGLQTLGQLRIIDVILVTLFELVLNFYILRRF
jgi:hypothetical protein